MANPELWAFIVVNTGLFAVSTLLTALSYLAYRRNDQPSYGFATIGFGLIIFGGLVEPLYQVVVRGDYNLDMSEMLLLQASEGALIAIGLGTLFYAVTRHKTAVTEETERDSATEEYTYSLEDIGND